MPSRTPVLPFLRKHNEMSCLCSRTSQIKIAIASELCEKQSMSLCQMQSEYMRAPNPKTTTSFPTIRRALGLCAATSIFLAAGWSAHADLIANGDFGTGDFSGWTVTNSGSRGQSTTLTPVRNFFTGAITGYNAGPGDYGVLPNSVQVDQNTTVPVFVDSTTFAAPPGAANGAFFNISGGPLDLVQSVNVPADGTYSINAQALPVWADDDIVTIFYDGTAMATYDYTNNPGAAYLPINALVSTTSGTHSVDFRFTFIVHTDPNDQDPPGTPSAMFIGDISMDAATPVPEATTFLAGALLLIPGTLCSLRRLRKISS